MNDGTNDTPAWAPPAAFAICSLVWGSTFLAISFGNDAIPPFWGAALRLGVAAVLLGVLMVMTRQPYPRGRALVAACGFGFLNFGASFCLLYWAEQTVPSSLAAVVYATLPLTTALLARAVGLEKLVPRKILGALVAIGGVVVIFRSRLSGSHPLGPMLAVIGGSVAAASSGVALKLGPRQHPLGANAAGACVGFVVCALASVLAGEAHPIPSTWRAAFPILYLATVGSIGAFVVYAWLVNHWELTKVSFISVVVPVVATTLGVLFRDEALTPTSQAGAAIVLSGVVIALWTPRPMR